MSKGMWSLITENLKIYKAFDKVQTPEQKSAATETKADDDYEKVGFTSWEVSTQFTSYQNTIYTTTAEKEKILKEYREMAGFPEVADALDDICDEVICVDDDGTIASLQVNNDDINDNKNKMLNLQKEFDYILERVLDFDRSAFALFRKFYVEAELYGELVLNPKNPKEGVKKVVLLPPETMVVDYDEYESIRGFKQKIENVVQANGTRSDAYVEFKNNEVAYINSGIFSKSATKDRLVIGYLDRAKVAYRQLKWMEDSLVIYRVVRAPERRVFTIDVGNLPKNKAEEYMNNIIKRYKQKKIYNPETGEIDVGQMKHCISLDTMISLIDGRELSLRDIITEYEAGKKLYVYSVNEKTGKVVPGEITWAGVTRKNAEVVKVTLDNGAREVVTPDHKFIMNDLSKKEAKDLKPGDSLRAIYRKESNGTVEGNSAGYDMYFDQNSSKWKYTHRMVAKELGILNKKKDKEKNTVHHVNFNKKNNSPDNLKAMSLADHSSLHHSLLWQNEDFRKKQMQSRAEYWASDRSNEQRLNQSVTTSYYNKLRNSAQHMQPYNHSELHKEHDTIRSKAMTDTWNAPGFKEHFSSLRKMEFPENLIDYLKEACLDLINDNKKITAKEVMRNLEENSNFFILMLEINKNKNFAGKKDVHEKRNFEKFNKQTFRKALNFVGFKSFEQFKENFVPNHKVIGVEVVNERMDTGCITAVNQKDPNFCHNFRLSNGVTICNSMQEDFWLPRRSDGSGPSVTNLGAQSNFSDIADVLYFVKKLYKSLKIPTKRLDEQDMFSYEGKEGTTTREEVKFSKYCNRIGHHFIDWVMQIYVTHLRLKGIWQQYNLQPEDISIVFNENNEWREYKKLDNLQARLNIYTQLVSMNKPIFADEWLKKNILKMSDEEIAENQKLLDKKAEKDKKEQEEKDKKEEEANSKSGAGQFAKVPGSDNLHFKIPKPGEDEEESDTENEE